MKNGKRNCNGFSIQNNDLLKKRIHLHNGETKLLLEDSISLELLYYDNPKYFGMSLEEQRRQLIEDLTYNYGFDIPNDCNIFDKLRYIYHREL